ncbi:hypothetical protein OG520_45225 (plasmid) [Streptomyces sp. NBC_00984]|uniref:hypothetical protein n=1 Tax=Streptomyces sp. NBC_00984 TaxID=2903700 RepID=UPI002F90E692|nr:hypothetical protein OG520_44010 [Streptomyces sp. NBC_00984]WSX34117.1 hypothetical protein OG520_45225 [Streptomyces sp. NBC_00984]
MIGRQAHQVDARLKQLGVSKELFEEALDWASTQANMCTDFDAPAMPGITFWSRSNRYLAECLTDQKKQNPVWKYTRRDSILRVVHPSGNHAITAISGSGGVGDLDCTVRSKNPKGRVMAQLVENNMKYERGGQGVFSSRDEVEFGGELGSMPLWFLLYERNDEGMLSAELSLPVKMEGQYVNENEWSERLPLFTRADPGLDIALLDAPPASGDALDFEVSRQVNN